ncbi:hypothetical protein CLV46_0105 [Diaminobutyricimonas aerilata]|uniref:DUF1680 family protein n=1 Tax=Diaminobutyricimonas aerilata TaxID=1162967 RepID=A0A2M9CFA2_9MICO|nr:beta-L-arabinofuranosidase domain-containing protein [Diaminobutyricimonas aerilata]PJJ70583.1 hypothetical protein CLV46_0105 [Diaminobutyricimonas aerilata]
MTPTSSPSATLTRTLEPFALDRVRLDDAGPFAAARDRMLHLARVYPVDRLLAVFRANAGLDTRGAAAPGTWEDFGHPREQAWGEADYPGRENAQTANLLRGHYAGHFLSMLSLAYAGERDPALLAKIDEFVAGLAEVQQTLAATGRYSHPGFLAAYGEWQFSRLEQFAPYGEIWAPYYTCHKIMAGLLDAFELAGSARALEVVTAMGHWVHSRLSRLEPERLQRMWSLYIAGEYGGMNETMARLSVVARVPEFLETARLFDLDRLLDAGARHEDVLTGMHANQHLPQLVGYLLEFEATGERRYLDAVLGLWEQIVPGRMFAHGGTGESELWGPPATVAGHIGHRNAETCAAYNLVKIARLLFLRTRDPRFMHYIERATFNQILGSCRAVDSDSSPEVTYMFPVHPGALPEYDNVGTCCGGTGLENHVKYQESVFLHGDGELWVNLFVPSELRWDEAGVRVALRTDGSVVRLRVDRLDGAADPVDLTMHVRLPEWLVTAPSARVGSETLAIDAAPGGYATVRRSWAPGDELELRLPTGVRAVPTIDDPRLHHLERGAVVLAARSDATTTLGLPLLGRRMLDGTLLTDARLTDALLTDAPLESATAETVGGVPFAPLATGGDERYHVYVRAEDAEVAFAGRTTGVPVRRRADDTGLLDDLWAAAAPTTRADFLDRLLEAGERARADGLLGRAELERVLVAGAEADLARDGVRRRARVEIAEGAAPGWRGDGPDGATVWTLPPEPAEGGAPLAVLIHVDGTPAASGWYTTPPLIRVEAVELDAPRDGEGRAPDTEVRIDDGPWRPYTAPFELADEGVRRVSARATGASGRAGHAARELSLDLTPPRSAARVVELGASVEITLSAIDDVSGVERIRWQGPGTFLATFQEAFVRALTDSEQVIEFGATDRAGNEEPRQRLVLPPRSDATIAIAPSFADDATASGTTPTTIAEDPE